MWQHLAAFLTAAGLTAAAAFFTSADGGSVIPLAHQHDDARASAPGPAH